ncbi:MAG: T9SS type A sorting domain-containing protein [Flavobacteriales bacterium]|nr:T9SS type A sorting domain-containing protein [Flavobacteriales bacterium]
MLRPFTTALVLLTTQLLLAQDPLLNGYSYFATGPDEVRANDVSADAFGNVFVVGDFRGTVDLDPGPDALEFVSAGGPDLYITKLDSMGRVLWGHGIGGSGFDRAQSVATLSDGSVVVVGEYQGTVDFDPGPGQLLLTNEPFEVRTFILRLDADGELVWAFNLGNGTLPFKVVVDAEDRIYAGGYFQGVTDLDPGPGVLQTISNGGSDPWVVKLNSAGALIWARSFGGPGFDNLIDIALDGFGHLLLTGGFSGNMDADPGPDTFILPAPGANRRDVFVSKWDTSGTFIWARQFTTTNFNTTGLGVCSDPWGNVITTGFFSGNTDFDPGPGTEVINGNYDLFVHKMDPDGEFLWVRHYGNPDLGAGEEVRSDAEGNIHVVGYVGGTVDFDPGPDQAIVSSTLNSGVLLRLDPAGDFIDVYGWSGDHNVALAGMDLLPDGNVLVCGGFRGTFDIDAGPDTELVSVVGELDAWALIVGRCTVSDEPEAVAQGFMLSTDAPGPLFQWIDCDTGEDIPDATEATFEAPGNGNFAVASGTLFCKLLSDCVEVLGTGVSTSSQGTTMQIIPNPANEQVALVLSEPLHQAEILIHDVQGRLLFGQTGISASTHTIDISFLAAGVHFVRVRHAGGTIDMRLLKQ